MSSLRLGAHTGGQQAPRRETMLALRFGRIEACATLVAVLYAGLAVYLVGALGITSSEALARTARVGTMWDGFDTTLVAFGFDRPPLLTALAAPFGGIEGLREHGLAVALTTAVGSALSVLVATGVARASGLTRWATVLFVAAFALNPLLVVSGALGLPEMIYASLVLAALAQFGGWLERKTVSTVVACGVALGAAFLLRYNVVLIVAVMAWAFWWVGRDEERQTNEAETAGATAMAFLVPVAFVAGLWTLLAWFPRGDLFGYLRLASDLSRLGAEDLGVLQRMTDLQGDPLGTVRWVGGWAALVAPASLLAILALAGYALREGERAPAALALVCASVVLPEVVAVFTGHGQAHVHHLFVAAAPAFAVLAYRERRLTHGVRPGAHERPRRRAQAAWCALLLAASLASAGVFAVVGESDPALAAVASTVRTGIAPAPLPADALAVAGYIEQEAGPGDVVADVERHASVMLAVGDLRRFRTEGGREDEATLYEPFGAARFVLVRRALAGQGPGRVERAYDEIFSGGASSMSLAFESGDYRIYTVTGPAIP